MPTAPFAHDLTHDQLKVLVGVVDHGGFSAAARHMRRTQGSVSYHIQRLEAQLELDLFDRSGHRPVLTPAGHRIVAQARQVLQRIDGIRTLAWDLNAGLEASISLSLDVLLDTHELASVLRHFRETFPSVGLEVETGIWSETGDAVRAERCDIGVAPPQTMPDLEHRPYRRLRLLPVIAADHPLASLGRAATAAEIAEVVHLVLPASDPDSTHSNPMTWRISDSHTRHQMICAGLGWARLPEAQVAGDLALGRLVTLRTDCVTAQPFEVQMVVATLPGRRLGPAATWLRQALAAAEASLPR